MVSESCPKTGMPKTMRAFAQNRRYHTLMESRVHMRAYSQSRQYYTIMESRVQLTWYQSHALKRINAKLRDFIFKVPFI